MMQDVAMMISLVTCTRQAVTASSWVPNTVSAGRSRHAHSKQWQPTHRFMKHEVRKEDVGNELDASQGSQQ